MCVDNGVDVISCSWGKTDAAYYKYFNGNKHLIRQKIDDIFARGIRKNGRAPIVVFGVGNEDFADKLNVFCKYHPNFINVSAINSINGKLTSNQGREVTVCAAVSGKYPMLSTKAAWDDRTFKPILEKHLNKNAPYKDFHASSAATPIVAGVVALILSANPKLQAEQVKQILIETASPVTPQQKSGGKVHSPIFGYGRVNAGEAVKAALKYNVLVDAPTPQPNFIPVDDWTNSGTEEGLQVFKWTKDANGPLAVSKDLVSIHDFSSSETYKKINGPDGIDDLPANIYSNPVGSPEATFLVCSNAGISYVEGQQHNAQNIDSSKLDFYHFRLPPKAIRLEMDKLVGKHIASGKYNDFEIGGIVVRISKGGKEEFHHFRAADGPDVSSGNQPFIKLFVVHKKDIARFKKLMPGIIDANGKITGNHSKIFFTWHTHPNIKKEPSNTAPSLADFKSCADNHPNNFVICKDAKKPVVTLYKADSKGRQNGLGSQSRRYCTIVPYNWFLDPMKQPIIV